MRAGWLNTIPGVSIVCGQVLSGAVTVSIGKAKYQCMVVLSLGGAFLAGKFPCSESILGMTDADGTQQLHTRSLQPS